MTGILVIDGAVDVSQFWPSGESDADTVKRILPERETWYLTRPHRQSWTETITRFPLGNWI